MEYIRRSYGVPAKRGGKVRYSGCGEKPKHGTITGSTSSGLLLVRMDGEKRSRPYHPTWCIDYLQTRTSREIERDNFEEDARQYGFDLTRHERAAPEPWSEYVSEATGHRWAGWLAAKRNKLDV